MRDSRMVQTCTSFPVQNYNFIETFFYILCPSFIQVAEINKHLKCLNEKNTLYQWRSVRMAHRDNVPPDLK